MAAISGASALSSLLAGSATSKTANPSSRLGRDEFLKLLVTQMTTQDPLEPVKDTEFISQMAQFSSLESMEKLNSSFQEMLFVTQMSQGAGMIGKYVAYDQPGSDGLQRGTVDSVSTEGGKLYLMIGGAKVALSQVRGIESPPK